jgi:hypothetical protein
MAMSGWADTVTSHVTEAVSEQIRARLFEQHMDQDCAAIAKLARSLLESKKQLHHLVGTTAGAAVRLMGADDFSQAVAHELAGRIPLPIDEPAVHVARALQMTGIAMCALKGADLDNCPCLMDLAITESQDRCKEILACALDDWANEQNRTIRAWADISHNRATR